MTSAAIDALGRVIGAKALVIPVSSDFYYASRPTLAIARPDSAVATSALSLDTNWGLHPALKDTIFPLYQKGQAAFIPFAGTDDLTRSHFETQDTIELGQNVNGTRDYRSGFMARLASALTRVRPIAFTDQMPLTFQGGESVPNVAINSVGKSGIDGRQASLIASMYNGKPLAASVEEGFQVRDDVYHAITDHMMEASRGAVSPKGFELSARRIGRKRRPFDSWSWTKSTDQRALGLASTRIGAREPVARLRPRRRRTLKPSSR
jgi:uncharacterized protein (DUF1501 family)